jgi:VWFA-related protein
MVRAAFIGVAALLGSITSSHLGGQFRSAVHAATISVAVVDSQGNPVSDLTVNDFEVTVDREASQVIAVEYITAERRYDGTQKIDMAPDARINSPLLNNGRVFVFLFDDLSFKPLPPKALSLPLERLLPMLSPTDRVGLTTTSGLGPSITPTLDRAPLTGALRLLAGRREDVSVPFFVGIDEALVPEARPGRSSLVRRECQLRDLGSSCTDLVLAAARREATHAVWRTEQQVKAIANTISWMQSVPEPRVLILVSDGIAADPRNYLYDQIRVVADAAAAASVQLYALVGVNDGFDMSDTSPERREARRLESQFLGRGVQTFAAAAGGEAFLVVGQPDRFMKRIVSETSAIYQLSVQLRPASRNQSQFLDVKVKVNRKGVSVRVRSRVMR